MNALSIPEVYGETPVFKMGMDEWGEQAMRATMGRGNLPDPIGQPPEAGQHFRAAHDAFGEAQRWL